MHKQIYIIYTYNVSTYKTTNQLKHKQAYHYLQKQDYIFIFQNQNPGPNLKTYTLHLPTNLLTEETFFVGVSTRWLVQLHSSPILLPPSDGPSTFSPWDFFVGRWML